MKILQPSPENIVSTARAIQSGRVVVIPTETVYGLACHALDSRAVQHVFEIKGRPPDNPLIVHIGSFDQLVDITEVVPPAAKALASRFWPGPLTLVLPKRPTVPYCTTGGLDTVAVRVPRHPVALAVIKESGCPVAAPSANLFTRLSPTSAHEIDPAILCQVDMVLDGGQCEIGLESTVLDLTSDEPIVLRPGAVTRADIQAVLGRPLGSGPPSSVRKSPGQYARHYAPRAQVKLVDRVPVGQPGLTLDRPADERQIRMPADPAAYAANLYRSLQRLDETGTEDIFVELPPRDPEWEAVHDRLKKASTWA